VDLLQIPDELKVYFWDVSIDDIDLIKHRKFIIARILNEGNQKALIWLFKTYDEGTIKQSVRTTRDLTVKTARCWQNFFDLKEDEICCTGQRLK
jgi:hypothetical protein